LWIEVVELCTLVCMIEVGLDGHGFIFVDPIQPNPSTSNRYQCTPVTRNV